MALIELKTDATRKELRLFGLVLFPLFLGIVGLIVLGLSDDRTIPIALWSAGALFATVGDFFPGLVRATYAGWMRATWPIGWFVSHLVIAIVFYGVVTPIGLALRILGRTPVTRRFDPALETYWTPLERIEDRERYFRQY